MQSQAHDNESAPGTAQSQQKAPPNAVDFAPDAPIENDFPSGHPLRTAVEKEWEQQQGVVSRFMLSALPDALLPGRIGAARWFAENPTEMAKHSDAVAPLLKDPDGAVVKKTLLAFTACPEALRAHRERVLEALSAHRNDPEIASAVSILLQCKA